MKYLERFGCEDALYPSPADISWDPATLVQPDAFVVAPGEIGGGWPRKKTLLLAVEIVSPSSRRTDYGCKRELYQRYAVREYWIVDPGENQVDVWPADSDVPTIATATLVWHPDPALVPPGSGAPEPLRLDLTALFRPPRPGG